MISIRRDRGLVPSLPLSRELEPRTSIREQAQCRSLMLSSNSATALGNHILELMIVSTPANFLTAVDSLSLSPACAALEGFECSTEHHFVPAISQQRGPDQRADEVYQPCKLMSFSHEMAPCNTRGALQNQAVLSPPDRRTTEVSKFLEVHALLKCQVVSRRAP